MLRRCIGIAFLPKLELRLAGTDFFGDKPHALWAGLSAAPTLSRCATKSSTR
jgi:hypothetical protein